MPGAGRASSEFAPLSADPTSVQARHVRRRPVLIRDEYALNRLSALIETRSVQDMDDRTTNPTMEFALEQDATGSRSAGSKSGKIKQITGDDVAQALHAAKAALASRPWYLQPVYGDEHIKVEFDGTVACGTLTALVERLTSDALSKWSPRHNATDLTATSGVTAERAFRHAFLSTFKTMATANEIFDLLLKRYHLDAPSGLTAVEFDEWRIRCLLPTQRRVLAVFTTWLVEHSMIEEDPPIARRLQQFLAEIPASAENVSLAEQVMKTLEHLVRHFLDNNGRIRDKMAHLGDIQSEDKTPWPQRTHF